MAEPENRRPLNSRDTGWARSIAARLAATSVTPNQISQASMAAALVAGGSFWIAGQAEPGTWRIIALVFAALFCQLRLLCNLFDGMVAVEGGKSAPDGPFWNEFPDRVSDALILAGLGYGLGLPALGWIAAALAILTAYVRELGANAGAPPDFSGPMAKPQRMATVTAAALLSLFEPLWNGYNEVLAIGLWAVVLGGIATVVRRSMRQIAWLKANRQDPPA